MIQIEGAAHQSSDPQFLDIIHHPLLNSYPPAPPICPSVRYAKLTFSYEPTFHQPAMPDGNLKAAAGVKTFHIGPNWFNMKSEK